MAEFKKHKLFNYGYSTHKRGGRVIDFNKRLNRTFKVIDRQTNQEIEDAFVLLPRVDSAARTALSTYAEATNNSKIARWLRTWLRDIHMNRKNKKENLSTGPS